ncbi:asparaginase [Megasphaera cerevisiae]|jgi:L-asparaginase|uniref:asparaginase n=1 Tax=Megasphaera cerevisiae TaxID=39029 RepID=UPI000944C696|nr:asparaginase [Megasphaera cerevisiae]MCI1750983.1 asparaginase [Megasphaera cerevisiae]OKY54225.1 L-asparaginase [Megasphaera cerevisiae]
MALPNVYIIACGGTIAGKAASAEDLTGYKAGEVTIDELLRSVPQIEQYAGVQGEQFCNIDSSNMTEQLWLALAQRVQEVASRPDVDGIVITHGTDTMEETAYFLHLTVHTDKPVVLVGSMRPSTAISADGPLNLLEAVRTAAVKETGRYGVVIAMNGTLCSARFVEKTDTTHADTFKGRQMGNLGFIQDGQPFFYQAPLRRHTTSSALSCDKIRALPPVAVVYCYIGMSGSCIDDAASHGVRGIVLAGLGHGRMPAAIWAAASAAMKRGIYIVRASRTMGGIVSPVPEYSGVICADSLTPQKAKILLQLGLLKTENHKELQALFRVY